MAGLGDWLKDMFAGKPAASKSQKPRAKSGKSANRAELIEEAMAIYRRERAHTRGILERALKELQAKPPKPSDVAGMTRLLSLRQVVLNMRGHLSDDMRRYKALVGVKGLLEAEGAKSAPSHPRPQSGRAPSQGDKSR